MRGTPDWNLPRTGAALDHEGCTDSADAGVDGKRCQIGQGCRWNPQQIASGPCLESFQIHHPGRTPIRTALVRPGDVHHTGVADPPKPVEPHALVGRND